MSTTTDEANNEYLLWERGGIITARKFIRAHDIQSAVIRTSKSGEVWMIIQTSVKGQGDAIRYDDLASAYGDLAAVGRICGATLLCGHVPQDRARLMAEFKAGMAVPAPLARMSLNAPAPTIQHTS